jgi:hypothetical protein
MIDEAEMANQENKSSETEVHERVKGDNETTEEDGEDEPNDSKLAIISDEVIERNQFNEANVINEANEANDADESNKINEPDAIK